MTIILASTSRYRAQQLHDLGLKFKAVAPKFDEEAYKTAQRMSPAALCKNLAREKALSVFEASRFTNRKSEIIVIGADQLVCLGSEALGGKTHNATFGNEILGKPGGRAQAIKMLMKMQGRSHKLITCVCVIGPAGRRYEHTETVEIKMRRLTRKQIASYVDRDRPFDCAGSYRLEKGGLALVEQMKVRDPSSLVGLPLIALTDILLKFDTRIHEE